MRAFIVSDHEPISSQLRQVLLHEGHDCPAGSVVPLSSAADHLGQEGPELILVVLSPDPERALAVLAALRSGTEAPLLAVGPTYDPKLVVRSLRAGADDFLDEVDLGAELEAALARCRAEQQQQAAPEAESGHVIAVLGASGGSGASTLAVNVATALAQKHQRAGLLDLRLESGDLAALLDLKPSHTLADLCQSDHGMDRAMFERSLARHSSGVHLLAAPRSFADVSCVTPDGVRQALGLARSLFPYVVVDLAHPSRPEQAPVLRQAEVILLVLRLEFTSLRNAKRIVDYLEQTGVKPERIRLVANRYGQAKEIAHAQAEEALSRKIFHYVPDDPKTINRANNNGVPAVLESPSARVCRSVVTLAASVNGHHKPQR